MVILSMQNIVNKNSHSEQLTILSIYTCGIICYIVSLLFLSRQEKVTGKKV